MNPSFLAAVIKSIMIPVVGIFAASIFNLFDYISIIPKDQTFKFSIAAYFAIFECIYVKLTWAINKYLKSNVECIFYCDKQSKSITTTPQLSFNEGVVYIHCSISIKGSASRLAENSLIISFPYWVEIQNVNTTIGEVNHNNEYIIRFSKLINISDKVVENASADIKIGLIKNPSDDGYSKVIFPSLAKNFMYKLTSNKFDLKNR